MATRTSGEIAAAVREALCVPDGYLRDAATMSRPWSHGPEVVRCPVRAWFGELDDRSAAAGASDLLAGFADLDVTVRPGTTHLATLVAHWPEVLTTLRELSA